MTQPYGLQHDDASVYVMWSPVIVWRRSAVLEEHSFVCLVVAAQECESLGKLHIAHDVTQSLLCRKLFRISARGGPVIAGCATVGHAWADMFTPHGQVTHTPTWRCVGWPMSHKNKAVCLATSTIGRNEETRELKTHPSDKATGGNIGHVSSLTFAEEPLC